MRRSGSALLTVTSTTSSPHSSARSCAALAARTGGRDLGCGSRSSPPGSSGGRGTARCPANGAHRRQSPPGPFSVQRRHVPPLSGSRAHGRSRTNDIEGLQTMTRVRTPDHRQLPCVVMLPHPVITWFSEASGRAGRGRPARTPQHRPAPAPHPPSSPRNAADADTLAGPIVDDADHTERDSVSGAPRPQRRRALHPEGWRAGLDESVMAAWGLQPSPTQVLSTRYGCEARLRVTAQ